MPEFFTLLPPKEALQRLLDKLPGPLPPTTISTSNALGRVLANRIPAPSDLPAFARSTMDGYAVRAQDTFGATPHLPAYLKIAGEVAMGSAPDITLKPAHGTVIHTGGMLPDNADAVVMIENTQPSREHEIEVLRAAAVGENILKVGEDVARGAEVLPSGARLRPQDLGALMAFGITNVKVTRSPIVGLIATGDEVIPPEDPVIPGQVRDINSYGLSGIVENAGGIPKRYGIIRDNRHSLQDAANNAFDNCDILVISAGSSASVRDVTGKVLDGLGEPGVIVHGIAVKPGKPTIIAIANGKPAIGLPGNPVSAMVIARLILVPIVHYLQASRPALSATITAQLTRNIASTAGREDYIPVKVIRDGDQTFADPVFGKSNLIFTLVQSDGSITIPLNSTGINRGDTVQVNLH